MIVDIGKTLLTSKSRLFKSMIHLIDIYYKYYIMVSVSLTYSISILRRHDEKA